LLEKACKKGVSIIGRNLMEKYERKKNAGTNRDRGRKNTNQRGNGSGPLSKSRSLKKGAGREKTEKSSNARDSPMGG